ncbi:PIR protein [Plasmodium yoelii]|uniref:Bir1 protein n=3 Tax=Plasmodium yoelii TaxID=5861 RepID=Q7RJ64_PLAYO|nr:PIR protein [Plasmodium yoelii]EAA22966.1 putative bir1 protein [Plasmodium yoelii yoelii]WBY55222.1 PIR protein [Plasmodium yoelii yoelii]CDU16407.1 YIR protein [Plasmodium yoelii]VTZ73154.1 PIR protein [Plasmodium yoelii]|eukprot:XP_022811525.1 PIR protein [Plasmodium yoelii]
MAKDQTNKIEYFIKNTRYICGKFDTLKLLFPDELDSGKYNFKVARYKNYLSKSDYTDIDKINGFFLWLLKEIFGNSNNLSGNANENMIIVTYVFSWLSYMLSLKQENGITKLNEFYSKHIENVSDYNGSIGKNTQYKTYKEIIDGNKKLMDIDIIVMSKFYDVFKNLCKMYDELTTANYNSEKYLEYVNNFANNYKSLINENFNDTNNNSFRQVLSVVLNDYNYIKDTLGVESVKKQFPELRKEKTATQVSVLSPKETRDASLSEIQGSSSQTEGSSSQTEASSPQTGVSDSQTKVSDSQIGVSDSETTLFSSLTINKLIPIPLILVATLILLGIAYKYSLFGFGKRSKKQHLRGKLKR